jgi:hypothetical protein
MRRQNLGFYKMHAMSVFSALTTVVAMFLLAQADDTKQYWFHSSCTDRREFNGLSEKLKELVDETILALHNPNPSDERYDTLDEKFYNEVRGFIPSMEVDMKIPRNQRKWRWLEGFPSLAIIDHSDTLKSHFEGCEHSHLLRTATILWI